MADHMDIPLKHPTKSRTKFILIVLPILLFLLAYAAGIIFFPVSILTNYQNRNCASALTLNQLYTKLYPHSIQDGTLSAQIEECKAYTLAVSTEEQENWQEAYNDYQAYVETYPNGLYIAESHEHSAIALIQIARAETEEGKYQEAISHLDLLLASYSDTAAYTDAITLVPSTYTAWEADLWEVGDFENAVKVLTDFKAWSQNNQNADGEVEAQKELTQTYLEWGMSLKSQQQFEAALAKLELAAAADPESKFDSAAQVKSARRKTFVEWGNQFLEQNEFSVAIEKFNLAISHSTGENEDGVRDALSNGYIQWAKSLSASEDFRGALDQMELAKQAAVTDDAKKMVGTALDEIYLAFSNSTGKQAQRAMKDALETVCKKNKKPDLPIFGLNTDSIHFGLYGVDSKLPEELAARTPGEMHYVACVKEEARTQESRYHKNIIMYVSRGYLYVRIQQFRNQILWNTRLIKLDTMESMGGEIFEGGPPPPFPESQTDGTRFFNGPPPEMEIIKKWLLSVIQ